MKACFRALLILTGLIGITYAAPVPPAEQLLSDDTIAVLSVPEYTALAAAYRNAPIARLWKDDAMREFREDLVKRLGKELIEPLERQAGIKSSEFVALLNGQLTVALTKTGWGDPGRPPGLIVILDTRDKAEQLKKNLAAVRTKLAESGRKVRTDRLREVELMTFAAEIDLAHLGMPDASGELKPQAESSKERSSPAPPPVSKTTTETEISFGQIDSLLLIGTSQRDLEKVIARLGGGTVPALADKSVFEGARQAVSRDVLAFGWVDPAPIIDAVAKLPSSPSGQTKATDQQPVRTDRLLPAIGLTGLKSLAFALRRNSDGTRLDLYMAVPEDQRKGLFKLIATEPKDATPPPWVPADATQFSRWRLDGQKFWSSFESTLNEIAPGVVSFLIETLENAMKEKDPAFDFRRYFTSNLGDDIISYQKAPRGLTPEELNSPPAINLIASPMPDKLLAAIKGALLLLPAPLNAVEFKEREFMGKRIYSLVPPSVAAVGGQGGVQGVMHFASAGGYLAMANDTTILEEYLRSGESKTKSLSETPGWSEAAQQVGGGGSGLMGYQSETDIMRLLFALLKASPNQTGTPLSVGALVAKSTEAGNAAHALADFSLLPTFEQVSKYFGMAVFAGKASPDGYSLRLVFPTPPHLRQ